MRDIRPSFMPSVVSELLSIENLNVDDLFCGPSDPPTVAPISASSPVVLSANTPVEPHVKVYTQNLSPLGLACKFGHSEIVHLLLRHGADPNMADDDAETPLHYAARNGFDQCVALLLNPSKFITDPKTLTRKADSEARDNIFFWTPVFAAAIEGHESCVRALIEAVLKST